MPIANTMRIDDDEQHQRREHRRGRHRRGGVGGAQDALHHPGLAAALGHHPAGDDRDEAGPPGCARRCADTSASRTACRATSSHAPISAAAIMKKPIAEHDAEGEEHGLHRRAVLRRHVLEPDDQAVEPVREDQRAGVRDRQRPVGSFSAFSSGQAKMWKSTGLSLSQCASMAAILIGWCLSVLSPCWSPISSCSGARIGEQHAPPS